MIATSSTKLSPEVNVYLLAENRLLRDTLARLLRKRSEINVVGVGRSSEPAKDEIFASNCDVVLMDTFENEACSSFLEAFLEQDSGLRVLLFGMSDDPETFVKAVHLGICGYLLKEASAAEIVTAVLAAARGNASCPPSLCMALIQYLGKTRRGKVDPTDTPCSSQKALTPRQLQLVRLVAEGLTNKEIAANLHLSQFTVKNHLRRVMRQVEAASRHDAVDAVRASGQLAT
ncbi:MAG TPA: response regulator transcription factor [Candidatus Sulfotelmatobacter sp.]|nr:response regulator transcription factor [Candidatus Sulfotelmatobacter sp.]